MQEANDALEAGPKKTPKKVEAKENTVHSLLK
jgi:hypothetical protein